MPPEIAQAIQGLLKIIQENGVVGVAIAVAVVIVALIIIFAILRLIWRILTFPFRMLFGKKPASDEYADTFGKLRSGESVTVGTHPQTDRSGETYYRGVKKIYKDTGFADHTFADGAHYDLEKDKKKEKKG